MKATAIHSNQTRRASPPDDLAVCRDRTPPMRSSLHASPRRLIVTNYQREIPSTPRKAAVVRGEVRRRHSQTNHDERAMLDLRNG